MPRTRGAALDALVNEVLSTMQHTPDFSLCLVPALSPNRAQVEAEAIGRESILALSWYRIERLFSGIEQSGCSREEKIHGNRLRLYPGIG